MVQVAKNTSHGVIRHFMWTATALGLVFFLTARQFFQWNSRFSVSTTLLNLTVPEFTPQQPVVVSTKQNESKQHKNSTRIFVTAMLGPKYQEAAQKLEPNITKSARTCFDDIFFYKDFPEFILHNPQWKHHLEFLQKPDSRSGRGAGYWFWKPVLIDHHLSQLEIGDILVYSDSDLLNSWFLWSDVLQLLKFMEQRDANAAIFRIGEFERYWTKRDVYAHFCSNLDQEKDDSISYAAGWHVIRKTPGTVRFYRDWVQGVSNFHFINDDPSKLANIKEFKQHRHDQSIMNLLLKCRYHEPNAEKFPSKRKMRKDVITFQFPD